MTATFFESFVQGVVDGRSDGARLDARRIKEVLAAHYEQMSLHFLNVTLPVWIEMGHEDPTEAIRRIESDAAARTDAVRLLELACGSKAEAARVLACYRAEMGSGREGRLPAAVPPEAEGETEEMERAAGIRTVCSVYVKAYAEGLRHAECPSRGMNMTSYHALGLKAMCRLLHAAEENPLRCMEDGTLEDLYAAVFADGAELRIFEEARTAAGQEVAAS